MTRIPSDNAIGPARITQLIPQEEYSGVTEVNLLRQLMP